LGKEFDFEPDRLIRVLCLRNRAVHEELFYAYKNRDTVQTNCQRFAGSR
jgi:hypothetical protein